MTLKEMSVEYTESANLIRTRIRELRAEKKAANSPSASYKIDRRIKELTPSHGWQHLYSYRTCDAEGQTEL